MVLKKCKPIRDASTTPEERRRRHRGRLKHVTRLVQLTGLQSGYPNKLSMQAAYRIDKPDTALNATIISIQ